MANKGLDGDSWFTQDSHQGISGEYDNFAIMLSENEEQHKLTILYDKNICSCESVKSCNCAQFVVM